MPWWNYSLPRKRFKIGLQHVDYCLEWLKLSLHICCLTQNPYWILSLTYCPWHVLGSQQTTNKSVTEGILMMQLYATGCQLSTSEGLFYRRVLFSFYECALGWRICFCHVTNHDLVQMKTLSHTSTPITHSHTLTHRHSFISLPQPRHAPKTGTDYSPMSLFKLWLLLHPARLSSGLLCSQHPYGLGPTALHMGTITQGCRGQHGARRDPYPRHNTLNTHFHSQSLQLITVIALSTVFLCSGVFMLSCQSKQSW